MTSHCTRLDERIEAALADYARDGLGVVRQALPADSVGELVRESERLWEAYIGAGPRNLRTGIRIATDGQPILDRLDPVADVSAIFAALNNDPLFVSIVERGLGEPVTVMKEKLIYKWPDTPGFGLHRDDAYTTPKSGVPGCQEMKISVALDAALPVNGPVEFFPALRNRPTKAPSGEPRDIDESEVAGVDSYLAESQPGDIVLFDGQIPHRSRPNRGKLPRRVYMISYVPARYTLARSNYYAGRLAEQKAERDHLVNADLYFE